MSSRSVKNTRQTNSIDNNMKSKANTTKEQTAATTTEAPKVKKPKAKRAAKAKTAKKAKKDKKAGPADRLPLTLDELKATKGGLVCYLFFSGKEKAEIVTELQAAFKLGEAQAAKIVRRITGRARLFQRVFELMAAK